MKLIGYMLTRADREADDRLLAWLGLSEHGWSSYGASEDEGPVIEVVEEAPMPGLLGCPAVAVDDAAALLEELSGGPYSLPPLVERSWGRYFFARDYASRYWQFVQLMN